ncbi:MAG: AAA family ATPase [Candidatus Micrarchaeota archaeon]
MAKLFDTANDANSIISREEALRPDYVPTEALHRTNEMETIASSITPMIHGQSCSNLFICGPTGTGKTTCMKLVANQLRESTSKVIPVYVNCWERPTKMGVYYEVAEALKLLLPRRGLAADEVFEKILDDMRRENLAILLILDELDSLVFKKEDAFLYNISRAGTERGVRFGVVAISNKKDLIRLLDTRVSSSLRLSTFEFHEYNTAQLKEILLERAKFALVPKTYDSCVLDACAKIGAESNGNARLAIEIMWKAALRADNRDAKKIEPVDVAEVAKSIEQRPGKKERARITFKDHDLNLSDEENLIINLLKGGEMPSPELYSEFTGKKDKTKRQIRNYLMLLEAKGLIASKEVETGGKTFLKTKVYSLKPLGAG